MYIVLFKNNNFYDYNRICFVLRIIYVSGIILCVENFIYKYYLYFNVYIFYFYL